MDAELCEVNNFSQTRPKYLLTNYLQAGAHACQPGDSIYTHQVIFVFFYLY